MKMGHKMISTGYIGSEPILRPAGTTSKLEFTVLWKRPTRPRGSNEYVDVVEAVRFVAWGDEAIRLSEKLRPGMEVEAIGSQETSSFHNQTTGQEESRVTFKLLSLDFVRKSIPSDHQGRHEQRPPARQQPRQRDDGYQEEDGNFGGEPLPPRNQGGHVQQRRPYQDNGPQRSHEEPRFARSNQGENRPVQQNGGGQGGQRFSSVY